MTGSGASCSGLGTAQLARHTECSRSGRILTGEASIANEIGETHCEDLSEKMWVEVAVRLFGRLRRCEVVVIMEGGVTAGVFLEFWKNVFLPKVAPQCTDS